MAYQGEIPRLGFGTYGRTGAEGEAAILAAIEAGYRHIDTAQSYDTEAEVGRAIRASGLPRDEIFVTTKVTTERLGPGQVVPSLEESLERLGLDTVDLALIHWPAPNGAIAPGVYLEQIAEAKARGLAQRIGVSNFTIALIDTARAMLGDGEMATNQIELNPKFQNRKVADHCNEAGILVTCYQPIARGRLNEDPVLTRIAEAHGATTSQVALAWELANGYAAIPTSSRPERIRENFAAGALKLTQQDLAAIDALEQAPRRVDPDWGPDWD